MEIGMIRWMSRTLVFVALSAPISSSAQQSAADQSTPQVGVFSTVGSVVLSLLYVPIKLTTCVGTQAVAAVAYTLTFGVPGSYDGGTNGNEIGEVAHKSCTGDWVITPEQVAKDYR